MRFKPSPTMVVAITALVFAIAGAAVASPGLTGAKKKKSKHADAKQDTALAASYLAKHKVPNAAHADSAAKASSATNAANAANATHATNADNADNADNAANAANAGAVSSRHVSSVFYAQDTANGPTTVLTLDGLTLKASCNTGTGVTLAADTVKDNSSLIITTPGQAAIFNNFDTSDNDLAIMTSGGAGGVNPVSNISGHVQIDFATPITGASVPLRQGGAVVSVSLQVYSPNAAAFGGTDACLLTGTAVSAPPIVIPPKRK